MRSDKKAEAVRKNGAMGGRPKKQKKDAPTKRRNNLNAN